MIRKNHVKQVLASGGTAVGTMFLEFATDGIGRVAAAAAEFGIFDQEHSGWSIEQIKRLNASTRHTSMMPMVRVPAAQYQSIAQVLDAGSMGLMVPMVQSAEQARQIVSWSKYPPVGVRGVAVNLAMDDYQSENVLEMMQKANQEILVGLQIENRSGLENVEEIAAVDGVDVLWIGQFDLTTSLGIPGEFDHPLFHEAVDRVLAACQRHGKAAVYGAMDLDELNRRREQGFRMLIYLPDIGIYQNALRQGLSRIRPQP